MPLAEPSHATSFGRDRTRMPLRANRVGTLREAFGREEPWCDLRETSIRTIDVGPFGHGFPRHRECEFERASDASPLDELLNVPPRVPKRHVMRHLDSNTAIGPAAILALFAVVGCSRHHTVERTATGAPKYDRLAIVYDLRDGHGALASSTIQPVQFVSAGDRDDELAPAPIWSEARLEIESPHAEARAGHARVTLRLKRRHTNDSATAPGSTSMTDRVRALVPWEAPAPGDASDAPSEPAEAVWVLDVPREQLDLLVVDLARSGFFETQTRQQGSANLDVTIDGGREAKAWDSDPRLDELAERVYTEGWIARPAEPPKPRSWWAF